MGIVAEWGIGTQFTVTHLVVSTLIDIEVNWSVSSWAVIAHTVAPWTVLGHTAGAEPINLNGN